MSNNTTTQTSTEERVAKIDATIEYHKSCITKLEAKKANILKPHRTRSKGLKRIIAESNLSDEAIACALGFDNPGKLKDIISNAANLTKEV